jgi:large subunit ribosomal protein L31
VKPGIHPNWYPDALVTCACGNSWKTGSTKKEIHTDVCNKCHPFFTGEQRIVDTAGQVERFNKRMTAKEQIATAQATVEDKRVKKDRRRERKAPAAVLTPEAPAEAPVAADEKPAE